MNAPEHLTPREVAALFGVRAEVVNRWARAGKLAYGTTPGGRRLFPTGEVMALRNGVQG